MLEVTIAPGQTLWEALAHHGIQLTRPCGGRGICGGCKVNVEGIGEVLSCRFNRPGTYRVETGRDVSFDVVMNPEKPIGNLVLEDESKSTSEVAEKSASENTSESISETIGDLASADVNKMVQEAAGKVSPKIADESASGAVYKNDRGIMREGGLYQHAVYIAVDIGTTTVALPGVCGERTAQEGFLNPQRSFGADVVNRIAAANAGQGEEMCAMLMEPLMEALERMRARLNPNCTHCTVGIAANTTMLHILRGFSCEGLGRAPFAPVDLKDGHDVWKGMRAEFDVYYMPGISAYVGADIVSGIYGLGMMEQQEVTMLLDLGTNGEMAIGNCNRLLCASAAAGPAFEGSPLAMQIHASGILKCLHKLRKCGMIDEYGLLDEEYFEEGYPVMQVLSSGDEETDRSRVDAMGDSGKELRITQDDIREIQMAKGAIRAGIEILLQGYGVRASQVSRVYLAGGMGYYLDPADAVGIGLLPKEFADRTEAVGNSCLTGLLRAANMAADDSADKAGIKVASVTNAKLGGDALDMKESSMMFRESGIESVLVTWRFIADSAEEIILAEHPNFEELYIEQMNFR